MDLRQYKRVLRAQWWVLVVWIVSSTAAAAALASTRPPVYAAQTQLFVSTLTPGNDPSQAYAAGQFGQQRVLSYAPLVSSPAVVSAVVRQLGLPETVPEVQRRITASVPVGTVLIDVTVEESSATRARDVADAVDTQFARYVVTLEAPDASRSPVRVSVVRSAELPTTPASPRVKVYLGFGLFLGVLLGLVGAVIREALDHRITDADIATAITGAPVIGNILRHRKAATHPLVVVQDPHSSHAEAYRRLSANLGALIANHPVFRGPEAQKSPRDADRSRWASRRPVAASYARGVHGCAFVVSSAAGGEGKSTVVANLGISMAQAGWRVAVMDADVRHPTLSDLLGVSSTAGLTNVLVGNVPVESVLQPWRSGVSLHVMSSGPTRGPDGVLTSARLKVAIDAVRRTADIVIVDSPAVLPCADASVLAGVVDGVIFLLRYKSTSIEQLESAAQLLAAANGHALALVLNGVPAHRAPVYGHSRVALADTGKSSSERDTQFTVARSDQNAG